MIKQTLKNKGMKKYLQETKEGRFLLNGITLQEAKDRLLKEINTPVGKMVLYGINLLPDADAIGLIFYKDGKQVVYFSVDCSVS